jgi:alkylated DNA nucleotide flippase Atl1
MRKAALATEAREARIVERVRAIPRGFVRTYGDIEPLAPRMTGRVLATTTERVPWHRVVRSDGSVAKGARQLQLLRREGVPLIGDRVDLRKARVQR